MVLLEASALGGNGTLRLHGEVGQTELCLSLRERLFVERSDDALGIVFPA